MKIILKTKLAGIQLEIDDEVNHHQRLELLDSLYRKIKVLHGLQLDTNKGCKCPKSQKVDI